MKGSIFVYDDNNSIAFKNEIISSKTIVFLDGLGGNILSNAYIQKLNEFCISQGITLVIPQLRSMPNFNIVPIEWDIEDINNVLNLIIGDVVLMGHSTGCNDILLYLKKFNSSKIKGVILQAPVSDPESVNYDIVTRNMKLIEDSCPENLYIELPNQGLWRKERYISLYLKNGKEDVFSSYLDDELFSMWSKKMKILSILSGSDEFSKFDLTQKFLLMGKVKVIEKADHSVSSDILQNELIETIDNFLIEISFQVK